MKNVKQFVKALVKIEFDEGEKEFGFYPFQMWVEDKDGNHILNSLLMGGRIKEIYKMVNEFYHNGAKRIFLATDFPKGGDIAYDFVAVFSVIGKETELFAIPYNPQTGERYPEVHKSTHLDLMLDNFRDGAIKDKGRLTISAN